MSIWFIGSELGNSEPEQVTMAYPTIIEEENYILHYHKLFYNIYASNLFNWGVQNIGTPISGIFLPENQVTYPLGLNIFLCRNMHSRKNQTSQPTLCFTCQRHVKVPYNFTDTPRHGIILNLCSTQRRKIPRDIFLEKILLSSNYTIQKRNWFYKNKLKGKRARKLLCFVSTR